jgi:hypothetical protein
MNIKLPVFQRSPCVGLTVCGWADSDSAPKKLTRGPVQFPYGGARRPAFVYAFAKRDKPRTRVHFHVDVVPCEVDDDEPAVSREELNAFFAQFEGVRLDAVVSARFILPKDEIPHGGVMATLKTITLDEENKLVMRPIGFEVTKTDSPALRISFQVDEDGTLHADFRQPSSIDVSDSYLIEAMQKIEQGFKALFAPPIKDGRKRPRLPITEEGAAR